VASRPHFENFVLESRKGTLGLPFAILRYKKNNCKNKTTDSIS